MSWFADFAGKAEDLLNKVDKTAATALQKQKAEKKRIEELEAQAQSNISEYVSQPNVYKAPKLTVSQTPQSQSIDKTKHPSATSSTRGSKNKSKTDDQLLEFLNSASDPRSETTAPTITKIKQDISKNDEIVVHVDEIEPTTTTELNAVENVELATKEEVEENEEQITNEIIEVKQSNTMSETAFLKGEISSLNNEIVSFEARMKDLDGENKRLKKQLQHWNSQISGSDSVIRELRDRENDLTTALTAKDSQLAVLRIRLEEADNEKLTNREIANSLKTENDRLLNEHTNVSGVHHEALDSLRQKLQKTETDLLQEQELKRKAEMQAFQQYSHLEEEKRQLMENITTAQKQISDQKSQIKDLSQQLRSCRVILDTSRQDLVDYRAKAQRILQSKEKLILVLKENQNSDLPEEFIELDSSKSSLLAEGDDLMQKEMDRLKDQLQQSQNTAETLRAEIRDLEQQYQSDIQNLNDRHRAVEETHGMDKQKREDLELELGQLKEELKYVRDDLIRTKGNMQSQVKDRDMEIEKLRRQLTTKSLNSSSQNELESRIRSLTENLIQKQTIVEALSTEKNSLVMQLERIEQKMKDYQVRSPKGSSAHVVGISDDGVKNRLPVLFNESPFDGNITGRVKRAYGVIDSLSIRMGSFLRHYPASRAFLLAYMALLHLWVMVVLMTYQPEVHGKHKKNYTGL